MRVLTVFIFVGFCVAPFLSRAQETSIWKHTPYGFVRADAFFDTRKSAEAVDGLFLLYPLNVLNDSAGADLNAVNQLTMTSISSRIGLKTGGGKVFNSKAILSANLEADFTARSNSNSFRLRQAWVKLSFSKHIVLMGRTWHPMFTTDAFPATLSINAGAPFNPFNRSPQIRYEYTPTDNWLLLGALLYQNDYKNFGLDKNGELSNQLGLMRNGVIPNIHLQCMYKIKGVVLGAFADAKSLVPKIVVDGSLGAFQTSESVESYAGGFFAKWMRNNLLLKSKAMLGQNLTDQLMTGGYAIRTRDSETGLETYTVSNHFNAWVNAEYGDKFVMGLFLGYNRNLGFSHHILPAEPVFARGPDIAYLYRISPYVKWQYERFELWFETELTVAAYGDVKYAKYGRVGNSDEVPNLRLQFSCVYLIL